MTIKEIEQGLNVINSRIFKYSLKDETILNELEDDYKWIQNIKEEFIFASFIGTTIEELESVRFKLIEVTLNLNIFISIQLKTSFQDKIRELKYLYDN